MHISIIVCIEFGVLEPYKMSGVPDLILPQETKLKVLEPYEMSGIPDSNHANRQPEHVLEPYEMSGVPDDGNEPSSFSSLSKKVIFILIFHNINEQGSETKSIKELKDKLHILLLYIKFGVLEPYEMSGFPDFRFHLFFSFKFWNPIKCLVSQTIILS